MVKDLHGAEARCIGVLTKCDQLPEEEGASDIIDKIRMVRESDVKLDLGFIAVRNRGPNEDSDSREQLHEREKKLFETHAVLKELSKEEWGYSVLTSKIVGLQSERIDQFIPEVKRLLLTKLKEKRAQLKALGAVPTNPGERRSIYGRMITSVERRLGELIAAQNTRELEMNIAARTNDFGLEMGRAVQKIVPCFLSEEYGKKIDPLIHETLGYSMDNFLADPVFRGEIHAHFFNNENMSNAALELTAAIHELMERVVGVLLDRLPGDLAAWPRLKQVLSDAWIAQLALAKEKTEELIAALLEAEAAQVYTQNHYYMDTINKIKIQAQKIREGAGGDDGGDDGKAVGETSQLEQSLEIDDGFIERFSNGVGESNASQARLELQVSLHCYAKVVSKRLFDTIPLIARQYLVLAPSQDFSEIMHSFCTDDDLEAALAEDGATAKKRAALERSIGRLDNSHKKLSALR
jgi:hypothetical protein